MVPRAILSLIFLFRKTETEKNSSASTHVELQVVDEGENFVQQTHVLLEIVQMILMHVVRPLLIVQEHVDEMQHMIVPYNVTEIPQIIMAKNFDVDYPHADDRPHVEVHEVVMQKVAAIINVIQQR